MPRKMWMRDAGIHFVIGQQRFNEAAAVMPRKMANVPVKPVANSSLQ